MTGELDPMVGRELLDDLGFLLVPGRPTASGTAYLFTALRPRPTLRHFDPERIEYWVSVDGHGLPATLEWSMPVVPPRPYSWGLIRVIDRLGVSNEFVSFGGQLDAARFDDVLVAVFSSDAPIEARGGHSQEWEPGSSSVTAFLARLRAAADPRHELGQRLAQTSPTAIYAAYVAISLDRYLASERSLGPSTEIANELRREEHRLRSQSAGDWVEGIALAEAIALAEGSKSGPLTSTIAR
jgi:hypothetical protein